MRGTFSGLRGFAKLGRMSVLRAMYRLISAGPVLRAISRACFSATATLLLAVWFSCALAGPLRAAGQQSAVPAGGVTRAELLPGGDHDGHRWAALHLALAPGWKTYWRSPGDAGIPPSFDWSGSSNLAAVTPHWPVPQVFMLGGLRSIGYHDDLVLPLALTPADPSRPIRLEAEIDAGVCHDICVPVHLSVSGVLPPGAAADPRVTRALADQPESASAAGVTGATCSVAPEKDGLRLTVTLSMPPVGPDEAVVVEPGNPTIWASAPDSHRSGRQLTAAADLVPPEARPFALDRSGLRFTVISGDRAVDIRGCSAG